MRSTFRLRCSHTIFTRPRRNHDSNVLHPLLLVLLLPLLLLPLLLPVCAWRKQGKRQERAVATCKSSTAGSIFILLITITNRYTSNRMREREREYYCNCILYICSCVLSAGLDPPPRRHRRQCVAQSHTDAASEKRRATVQKRVASQLTTTTTAVLATTTTKMMVLKAAWLG
jgi:hypothetical protein